MENIVGGYILTQISIGICAYNEEKIIASLLDNLLNKQNLPQDTEIIVVCSGCTDSTPEIVTRFSERDERIKLIVEPIRRGKAPALNKILKAYTGDIFVHVDADHFMSLGAIQILLNRLSNPTNPTIGAVSGCQIPFGGENFMD